MLNSRELFKRRARRTRKSLLSKTKRPRLSVFRSSKHIYAQIIDDGKGVTLAAETTRIAPSICAAPVIMFFT